MVQVLISRIRIQVLQVAFNISFHPNSPITQVLSRKTSKKS